MHELLRNLYEQHELFGRNAMHEYLMRLVMHELLFNLYGQHELFGRHSIHEYLIARRDA